MWSLSERRQTEFPCSAAFVTGAGTGIGRALCEGLCARGCSVVMTDIDEERVRQASEEVAEEAPQGVAVRVLALDVTDARAFAEAIEAAGEIDLLVNNAGTVVGGEVKDMTLAHWDRVIDTNLKGAIHGIGAAYPAMVSRGRGHVVNIASLVGLIPTPLMAPYAASKSGLVGLGLALRAEAARHGVRVTTVCPGIVETSLLDRKAPEGLVAPASAPEMPKWTGKGFGNPQSPASLADEILEAIETGRGLVVTPWRARVAWRFSRAFPMAAGWIAERRVRAELGSTG